MQEVDPRHTAEKALREEARAIGSAARIKKESEDRRAAAAASRKRSREERDAIIGARISVLWPGPGEWFAGVVKSYAGDAPQVSEKKRGRHLVKYDLGPERWEKLFGRPGTKMEWKPITRSPFG
jgi:sarcosine oxidase gamma subunit